ncbi:MAG: DUF2062 domain-containing protein [Gammaproteobacteria bacterium]
MNERFFRGLLYHIRARERLILRKLRENPRGWAARLLHADMLRITRDGLCRGLAIGMFWGFAPMPFQMIPAAFFCWLARANLPAAILCVWISNPFTYAPIFFAEYQIGVLLSGEDGISWEEFRALMKGSENPLALLLREIGEPILRGALAASAVMAAVGYAGGALMFHRLRETKRRLRRRFAAKRAAGHAHPR